MASLRRKVFDTIHGLSHPGANTTVKLVASKFVISAAHCMFKDEAGTMPQTAEPAQPPSQMAFQKLRMNHQ